MMNERRKVLEMLQDGRITVEQAAELLSALDDKATDPKGRREFPFNFTLPRMSSEDLKSMTNQIKTTVQQHFEELKKNIDLDDWSFKSAPRVAATIEKALAPENENVSVTIHNGRIRVSPWDGDHVRIQIRSYVKADSAEEARAVLEGAVLGSQYENRFELSVQSAREIGETSIEMYIPTKLKSVKLASHNGSIRVDEVQLEELTTDTHNGGIVAYQVSAGRMRLIAHNGNIDLQHSVSAACKSVYAATHNGKIDMDGIDLDARISGTAKAHHGRIEVTGDRLTVEYDNAQQRQHARFFPTDASSKPETQVFCETHNGMIVVRA